eukprot:PhF_6_TR40194/c0_g1_i2/m.59638/K16550/RPGRIP1L; protein fantom
MSKKWDSDIDWKERYNALQQDFTNFKTNNQQTQKENVTLKRALSKITSPLEQMQVLSQQSRLPLNDSNAISVVQRRSTVSEPNTAARRRSTSQPRIASKPNTKPSGRNQKPSLNTSAPQLLVPSPPILNTPARDSGVGIGTVSEGIQKVLTKLHQQAIENVSSSNKTPETNANPSLVAASPRLDKYSPRKVPHAHISSGLNRNAEYTTKKKPQGPLLLQNWVNVSLTEENHQDDDPGDIMRKMSWGCDTTIQHRENVKPGDNDDLTQTVIRQRYLLSDAELVISTLRDELVRAKEHNVKISSLLEEARSERNHVVLERDVLGQMLETRNAAFKTLSDDRDAIAVERNRFAQEVNHVMDMKHGMELENKRMEMHMTEQKRMMAEDIKEKSAQLTTVTVRLSSAESSVRGLRETNESLLSELRTMNSQLIAERKTVIALTRELQGVAGSQDIVHELRTQLDAVNQEVRALHAAKLQMVTKYEETHLEEQRILTDEWKRRVDELKLECSNWESVTQIQWKEFEQLSKQHSNVRFENEALRRKCDELEQQLNVATRTLDLTQAKMRILCPSAEEMCNVEAQELRTALAWIHAKRKQGVVPSDITEKESESLAKALERSKRTVEVLNEHLQQIQKKGQQTEEELRKEVEDLKIKFSNTEKERKRRIAELEQQVLEHRPNGSLVEKDMSVLDLNENEIIVEVYIGRMDIPPKVRWLTQAPRFVATVDFLVHEPSVTEVFFGWTPTFDSSFSYRVEADESLLYILHTQPLVLSVVKVDESTANRTVPFVTGSIPMDTLIGVKKPHRLRGVVSLTTETGDPTGCTLEYEVKIRGRLPASLLALRELMFGQQIQETGHPLALIPKALQWLKNVVALEVYIHSVVIEKQEDGNYPLLTAHYSLHTLNDVMIPCISTSPSSVIVFDSKKQIRFTKPIEEIDLQSICLQPLKIILWNSTDQTDVPWGVASIRTTPMIQKASVSERVPIYSVNDEGSPPVLRGELHVTLEWVPPPPPNVPVMSSQTHLSLDEEFSAIELET